MGRIVDCYVMACWRCSAEVEIPAGPVDARGGGPCPRCGVWLASEWRRSREEATASAPVRAAVAVVALLPAGGPRGPRLMRRCLSAAGRMIHARNFKRPHEIGNARATGMSIALSPSLSGPKNMEDARRKVEEETRRIRRELGY